MYRMELVAVGLMLALTNGAGAQENGGDSEMPAWCQSEWGPEDQIGNANLLTAEGARAAAKLVKEGRTYALGVETNAATPTYGARGFRIVITQPGQAGGAVLGANGLTLNDDLVIGNLGIGSQIDGLGHAGRHHIYYNCNKAADFARPGGLIKLGIEKVPPMATRGVLLDMTEYYGEDPVPGGTAFNREEIEAQAKAQGVEIHPGDVVLFHTGWLAAHGDDADAFLSAAPGLGYEGGRYLAAQRIVAVGVDNWGVEVSPNENESTAAPVHLLMLAQNGIYLLEMMNTNELAADDVSEFMFVLGVPRVTGAVQAIINPIAIR